VTDQNEEQPVTQTWDAFWAEVQAEQQAEIEQICGVDVPVPVDMELQFSERVKQLRESDRDEDIEELVSMLFGSGVLAQWRANGMTQRGFRTVLLWGMARAEGLVMTFREAYDRMVDVEANPQRAAAPNREQRRAAAKRPSASTGGRSKRTSSGSTGSGRKKSPA
jgi:hypothetical protein